MQYLSYTMKTGENTITEYFSFNQEEGLPTSKKGKTMLLIENEPAWAASIFHDDLVRKSYYNTTGDKRYELSNHLGNVLSVVSDKKIPTFTGSSLNYFNADIKSYSDYYPFGMLLSGRHGNSGDYRYGFQGQEMDNEIKGEGNSLNYKFRMQDVRLGRFFATDPLKRKYPDLSPYHFSHNSPIYTKEIEGLEGVGSTAAGAFGAGARIKDPIKRKKFFDDLQAGKDASAMGAITGVAIWASAVAGYSTYLWTILNPASAAEIANEATAVTWSLLLDEPYPGPAIGDDVANGIKLTIRGLVDSKIIQKFTIRLGKLNFALGEGTTVLKDLAKIDMKRIRNMAKSLIRGKMLKDNGIKTAEDMTRLTVKAFDEGTTILDPTYKGLKKQISLGDGTKVNFSFEKVDDVYDLKTVAIPAVDSKLLKSKVKELKDKAIELGNKNL